MSNELDAIVAQTLRATLSYARDTWIAEAQERLSTSRADYIRGLSTIKMTSDTQGYIELSGKWPVMLEEGFGSFDIKDGFSKSPKKTNTKDGGWYLTIPYRHKTSGNGAVMPSNIKKESGKLKDGGFLEELLVRELGYKPQISSTGYKWKNAKYDQLNRIVKEYSSGKRSSQYLAFRRVGSKSDPKSWKHPGFKGLKALDRVSRKTEEFFYDYLDNL